MAGGTVYTHALYVFCASVVPEEVASSQQQQQPPADASVHGGTMWYNTYVVATGRSQINIRTEHTIQITYETEMPLQPPVVLPI